MKVQEIKFSGQIWQIFRDYNSKYFVLELKSKEKHETTIAVCYGDGMKKELVLPNNRTYYSLAAVVHGCIFVHHFPDKNSPIPKGIIVFDLNLEKKWENSNVSLVQTYKHFIEVEKDKNKFYLENSSGEICKPINFEKELLEGEFPILLTTEDEEFTQWQDFFKNLLSESPVVQMEIYQKQNPLQTFSILYFLENKQYKQELIVLQERHITFHKTLAKNLDKLPVDTCWVHEDCLVYIVNKNELLILS